MVGENPISTSMNDESYIMAQQLLDVVTSDVLGMGWRFNTHYLEDGTEQIDTVAIEPSEGMTEEEFLDQNFAHIPVHIQQVIVAKVAYEFSMGYTGENTFSQDLYQLYQLALAQAKQTEVMLSAELVDYERIYKNIAAQLLNEEGWWWNTTEDGEQLITSIPLNLPPIADNYARLKAQRIFQAYNTGNSELLLQPTPEEQEVYQQMLKLNRRRFLHAVNIDTFRDYVVKELYSEGLTDKQTYEEVADNETGDGLVQAYADAKARRLYLLTTEVNSPDYLQAPQEEINLYQRIRDRANRQQSETLTFQDILENIRTQLKNEVGWWYNTTIDENDNIQVSIPATLPQIADQYAEAKARRLHRAYSTGDHQLLIEPSPEEQELYQKMLEAHNRNMRGAKSLQKLRKEITLEILLEGWAFNTTEATYEEIKAAGYQILKASSLTPTTYVYLDAATGLVMDRKTNEEVSGDTKLKVIYYVDYSDLPSLFKSYIDLRAARVYNFYHDVKNSLIWSRPTADEMTLFAKLKSLYRTDFEYHSILHNDMEQSMLRGW